MYTREFLLGLYRTAATIRAFELRCVALHDEGLIRGYYHPYLGEEAVAVGACAALEQRDYIVSTHRGHGHCIARGARINEMMAEILGKKAGYCLGLGGSMHIADPQTGNLGANGIVGGGIAMGVGAALGATMRGEDRVCAVFFSDGASNNGIFPESLNLAAVWNAPVIFVLENNHYAVCTPAEESCRSADLHTIGEGYRVENDKVDGNDTLAVYERMKRAVSVCRAGKGPVLLEAKTYRHGGHHVNDPGTYMPRERLEHYKSRDPLTVIRKYLRETDDAGEKDADRIDREARDAADEAVAFAGAAAPLSVDEFSRMVEYY